MPKGDNPNSKKNLIKPSKDLTTEEQRKRASKAGKASAEARRANASLTEALKQAVTPEVAEQLTNMLLKRAKAGNLKAYELVRDQLGEKPVEKIEQRNVEVTVEFED